MADYNCSACADIKATAPSLVVNGLGEAECNSLKNNLGLNPASVNDNCTDLENLNDCLIGNMESEIDAYDVCDWKDFTKNFIGNAWTTFKALICSMCGLWSKTKRLECQINALMNGISFDIGEEPTEGSYIVAGMGVSFLESGSGEREAQVSLAYVGGGLVIVQGSLNFHASNFTDAYDCYSFDTDAADPVYTKSRKGNSVWNNTTGTVERMLAGGELIFELRINKAQYPQLGQLFAGTAAPTGGGMYQANLTYFDEGSEAYGQRGNASHSVTHTVPAGWVYVQMRMTNIGYLSASGATYSPRGWMGIRLNQNGIQC